MSGPEKAAYAIGGLAVAFGLLYGLVQARLWFFGDPYEMPKRDANDDNIFGRLPNRDAGYYRW